MKYTEIVLKLAFLAGAIYVFVTKSITSPIFGFFLLICLFLGIVLFFNKKNSYGTWGNKPKDILMRRVEGILLVIFAIGIYVIIQ